jgi:hypothetical protein
LKAPLPLMQVLPLCSARTGAAAAAASPATNLAAEDLARPSRHVAVNAEASARLITPIVSRLDCDLRTSLQRNELKTTDTKYA